MSGADTSKITTGAPETIVTSDNIEEARRSVSPEQTDDDIASADIESPDKDDTHSNTTFYETKWQHQRKRYNDRYLDLFTRTHSVQPVGSNNDLKDSQIGAVRWTANEKEIFFTAIARHGRHNLHHISSIIETKSPIEVRDYLDRLQEAFADRQLYLKDTKNVSHAEIEAAIEIGPQHERTLSHAADALSAFQEYYDVAAGQQRLAPEPWIIDREVAKQIDASHRDEDEDEAEDSGYKKRDTEGDDNHTVRTNQDRNAMFRLRNWLDLSEKFFMNRPSDDDQKDWSQLAEKGQTPALTQEAVDDFHNLTMSLTQRILQVAIFMAKSRIRATSTPLQTPARVLTRMDVRSAVDILNMPCTSWDFWKYLARRNGFQVTSGNRNDRRSVVQQISVTEAERQLSQMSERRQVSRSTSRGRSLSLTSNTSSQSVPDSDGLAEHVSPALQTSSEADQENDSSSDAYESSSSSEGPDNDAQPSPSNPKKRKVILEEAEDDYMERMDQLSRRQEERFLLHTLRRSVQQPIKDEDDDDELGARPKTLRKDKDDLRGWSCSYMAEWELFGERASKDMFANRNTKRHKQEVTDSKVGT